MRLVSLWCAGKLGYLERLTLASAMSVGHEVTVYSYTPHTLIDLPAGVALADANEVMSDPLRTRYFRDGHMALGSDFFRYEALANDLGCWIDLDLIFLKAVRASEYIFGWENAASINGAVLKLPSGPLLNALRTIPSKNWLPPYFGPIRTMRYWAKRMRGLVPLEDLPWGSAGPGMLTHLVGAYGLEPFAHKREVFYPLPYESAQRLYDVDDFVERLISPETVTIHLWNSRLRALAKEPPPANSFIARMCAQHKVDIAP